MCRYRQCAILQVPVELFSGNYVEICGKKYSLRSIGVFRRLYERQNQVKTGSEQGKAGSEPGKVGSISKYTSIIYLRDRCGGSCCPQKSSNACIVPPQGLAANGI